MTPQEREQIDRQMAPRKLDPKLIVSSLELQARPLKEVLDAIAKAARITVAYDSAVTNLDAPTSVKLANVSAEEALQTALAGKGLTFKVGGFKSVLVHPDTPAGREKYAESVRTFSIVHANVNALIQALNNTPSMAANPNGLRPVAVAMSSSRTITVKATADKMAEIAAFITANDKK